MRNLKHILYTETALDDFANISEPNSISPTTVRTLLHYLLLQIDDGLDQIWTDGSGIHLEDFESKTIAELLNMINTQAADNKSDCDSQIAEVRGLCNSQSQTLADNSADIQTLKNKVAQGYKLPHIYVASRDDEILSTLDYGVYSVIISNTPHLLVCGLVGTAYRQVLFSINFENWNICYRNSSYSGWSEWQTTLSFKSQDYTEDIEVSIENDEVIFNEFPGNYLHRESIVTVRCLLDEDHSTVFIGKLAVRHTHPYWEYLIYAPYGIYKATGNGNNPPTNWTLKKYAFQND